jgi:hypothetical protein
MAAHPRAHGATVKSVEIDIFNYGYPDADEQIPLVFVCPYVISRCCQNRWKSRATGHFHATLRQR